jgi:choline kinase
MKGVILAAGTASRLRPLTNDKPKCLLPIGGEAILGRTLDNLSAAGIDEIVIVTGYLAPLVRRYAAEKFPGLRLTFIHNDVYAATNNIYSLWLAKEEVFRSGMLLLDSDIIFDGKILEALLDSGHADCLAVKTNIILGGEEIKVTVDGRGRILEIGKDVPSSQAIGESIGIEKFGPAGLELLFAVIDRKIVIEKNVNEFYEAAFQEVIDRGGDIYAVDVGKYKAIEIDTVEDIRTAEADILPYLPPISAARANRS